MRNLYKILLIDDHDLMQWAIMTVINTRLPEAEIYSASSLDYGKTLLQKNETDLIILDVDVSGANDPDVISSLRNIRPNARILVYTGLNEEFNSVTFLSAGADGFLSKSTPSEVLIQAIDTISNGEKYMSSKTQGLLAQNYLNNVSRLKEKKKDISITPRESQIIRLLLTGKWTKEIAAELGITWSTVSSHKMSIFEKFGVTNVIQLYRKIEKQYPDLIDPETPQNGFLS
jgi:two-component system invasion response regulator UvrY